MAAALSPTSASDAALPVRARRLPVGPLRQALSALGLLLAWQALSQWVVGSGLLPSPIDTFQRAVDLTMTGELPRGLLASLGRILVGYVVGSLLGIALGLLMGRLTALDRLVTPSLGFVRSIPPIAFVPFSIILFGIGEMSKYAVVVYLVTIVLALNTAAGVRETPRIRIRAAQALGAGGLTVLFKVVLPSAVPFILAGLRMGLSLGFMAVVSAELIGARSGIGHIIMDSQTMMETDRMLVGILSLGILGALLDRTADLLIGRLLGRFTHQAA